MDWWLLKEVDRRMQLHMTMRFKMASPEHGQTTEIGEIFIAQQRLGPKLINCIKWISSFAPITGTWVFLRVIYLSKVFIFSFFHFSFLGCLLLVEFDVPGLSIFYTKRDIINALSYSVCLYHWFHFFSCLISRIYYIKALSLVSCFLFSSNFLS